MAEEPLDKSVLLPLPAAQEMVMTMYVRKLIIEEDKTKFSRQVFSEEVFERCRRSEESIAANVWSPLMVL